MGKKPAALPTFRITALGESRRAGRRRRVRETTASASSRTHGLELFRTSPLEGADNIHARVVHEKRDGNPRVEDRGRKQRYSALAAQVTLDDPDVDP